MVWRRCGRGKKDCLTIQLCLSRESRSGFTHPTNTHTYTDPKPQVGDGIIDRREKRSKKGLAIGIRFCKLHSAGDRCPFNAKSGSGRPLFRISPRMTSI